MKIKHHIAACVSPYSISDQIVRTAAEAAADDGSPLTVVSVLEPSELHSQTSYINYLQELSRECCADLAIVTSSAPAQALVHYFKTGRITHAFMGTPAASHGFGPDVAALSKNILKHELSIILLPPLAQQQITYIDTVRASELTLFCANNFSAAY